MPGPVLGTEGKVANRTDKILSHEQLMNFTVKETINDMLEMICPIEKSKVEMGDTVIFSQGHQGGLTEEPAFE